MAVGHPATERLHEKAVRVWAQLAAALARHERLIYANSLGAEAMVLTDIIGTHLPRIPMFSIDTGRLFEEALELLEKLHRRYSGSIRIVYPHAADLERLVAKQGVNGFYRSVEARLECCWARKIEPFRRAISSFRGWITGVRRERSAVRAQAAQKEWDERYGLWKLSPLLDWSEAEVWQYICTHDLPYNPLHDRQFPSIGCSPCTRAIQPGESRRSGRWWWERVESRECGLHSRSRPVTIPV